MRDPYYDIQGVSASGINSFYRSPLHYWIDSPFNADRRPTEETPALVFGRLAHCMVLTPASMNEFIVAPGINRRTNDGKAEFAAFLERSADQTVVTSEQFEQATGMRDAMMANPTVRQLLGKGKSEEPVTWHREQGGIQCKAKLDYLRDGLVIDYKTTLDTRIDEFNRSILRYGYHRQMAWYMDAAAHHHGERPRGAVIIAQNKDLPEDIGVFALDGDALSIGAQDCDFAYGQISRRLETMDWRSHPPEIQQIELPGWYLKQRGY